ncbi:hypothetical protein [Streptomyces sp. NPDC050759]|uniref:hypothetical protein n=1 Tax=Streptomyces sp. NPDC050759 TaxID=3365635 RepID=UPI0037A23483
MRDLPVQPPGRPAAQAGRGEGRRGEDRCGLAGNLGFEEQHYDTSTAVADLALKPRLDALGEVRWAVVVADGFSCATQIDHLAGDLGIHALHLAELLDPAADPAARRGETS